MGLVNLPADLARAWKSLEGRVASLERRLAGRGAARGPLLVEKGRVLGAAANGAWTLFVFEPPVPIPGDCIVVGSIQEFPQGGQGDSRFQMGPLYADSDGAHISVWVHLDYTSPLGCCLDYAVLAT